MQLKKIFASEWEPLAIWEGCLGGYPSDRARADTHAKPGFPNSSAEKFRTESNSPIQGEKCAISDGA